jgi:hypothetical protein
MTQIPFPVAKPEPGTIVRLRSGSDPGVVVTSDEFMDTLRLRGVSPMDQVLVEWVINGQPTRIWERVTFLENAPSMPATNPAMPVVRP